MLASTPIKHNINQNKQTWYQFIFTCIIGLLISWGVDLLIVQHKLWCVALCTLMADKILNLSPLHGHEATRPEPSRAVMDYKEKNT